jgi:hypothetical protein
MYHLAFDEKKKVDVGTLQEAPKSPDDPTDIQQPNCYRH